MAEPSKEPETKVEPGAEPAKTTEVPTDDIATSVFDKIKDFFSPKEPETKKDVDEINQQKGKANLSDEDIQKIIDDKINDTLKEVLPKAKKAKEDSLKAKEAELAQQKAEALDKELDKVIDSQYKDYLKFKMANEDNFDLETYLKDNPQYAAKSVPKSTDTETGTKGTELSQADMQIYQNLKRQGLI